jgi:hypothetical protein
MSAAIHCPSCGHSLPSSARPGVAILCVRCDKAFTPAASPFEPIVQPEMVFGSRAVPDVDSPSSISAFLAIFAIVGLIVLLCGGIGGYFAINARKRIMAEAENVKKANGQHQRQIESERKTLPQPQPPSPPIPQPPAPPAIVDEPAIQQPRSPPAGTSLDELLTELNAEPRQRPAWLTLQEIARLPVQEDRMVDVSSAIERHLRSGDSITQNAAAKAVLVWGTEWNADSLLELIDSRNPFIRRDAMRALAKVRPTEGTAELLLAQVHQASNAAALRDAFQDLGPVGEQAMLGYLHTDDRATKQAILRLLGEVGSLAAVQPLEELIRSEPNDLHRADAEHSLRKIRSRHP